MERKKDRKFDLYQFIIILVLVIVCIFLLYPVLWSFVTSFKTNADIMKNRTAFWPEEWTLIGYKTAFQEVPLARWTFNSVFVTAVSTIIIVFTSTLVGFIFAKYDFPFKERIFLLMMTTLMVPAVVTMVPRYLMIQKMGLFNTVWALIVPRIISPFSIFMARQFISDIPDSMCEAAKIDGAGPFKIYWKIILPNIIPLIGTICIFTIMGVWNDYLNPIIMSNEYNQMTLPLGMIIFEGQRSTDLASTMAMANIVMAPMIVMFLIFQKFINNTQALSGMK